MFNALSTSRRQQRLPTVSTRKPTKPSLYSTWAAVPSTYLYWEVGDGVFEVQSTSGDTHLGGDDFDHVLVNWLAEEFQRSEGIDLRKDPQALQRLTEAAEKAKIEIVYGYRSIDFTAIRNSQ